MNLYFLLFHGRKDPKEVMDDWGFDGPIFGPIKWVHGTYCVNIKLGYSPGFPWAELRFYDDMVYYDGNYYGDWSASVLTEEELNRTEVKERLTTYEENKSRKEYQTEDKEKASQKIGP